MISETNKGNDSNLELYGFTSVCILTLPVEILESVHWHTNRAPHNTKLWGKIHQNLIGTFSLKTYFIITFKSIFMNMMSIIHIMGLVFRVQQGKHFIQCAVLSMEWTLSQCEVGTGSGDFSTWVLKFRTLVACQKGLDKQLRLRSDCFWSLTRVFPVCYSDKHFVNSSPKNQHFVWEQEEKSVWNFRTFTVYRVTVTLNFRPYDRRYTSPNENFEHSYPLNM